ncbi:hypothetical protein CDAR_536471, partial [Caerostris darwini]
MQQQILRMLVWLMLHSVRASAATLKKLGRKKLSRLRRVSG